MYNKESPFDLGNDQAYQQWRKKKIHQSTLSAEDLIVTIADPFHLTTLEKTALETCCARVNMAVYDLGRDATIDKAQVRALGRQMGLVALDGNLCADDDQISTLQIAAKGRQSTYIPYTDKPIQWHTDGYYNSLDQQIRGMILHCAQAAAEGGENAVLDHEMAYILLRDENPAYIEALMQMDVMTIPPNYENNVEVRAAQVGPVFSVDAQGYLHMRYTARTRSIEWKQDSLTQAAINFLRDLLLQDLPYIYHLRLIPGQGLICNNVLHNRTAFVDGVSTGQQRMIYRARSFDRVRGI